MHRQYVLFMSSHFKLTSKHFREVSIITLKIYYSKASFLLFYFLNTLKINWKTHDGSEISRNGFTI